MTRRIGIYPGTFDPVHAGHVAFARAALSDCQLDEVIFLPEKQPRGKQNVTDISHRIALLQKVAEDTPRLSVATPPSSQFTVRQTLPEIRALFKNAELALLVGSDVVHSFPYWPDFEVLAREISLVIGMRDGNSRQEVEGMLQTIAQPLEYTLVETNFSDLASSRVRNGAAAGLSASVDEYVNKHALYSD